MPSSLPFGLDLADAFTIDLAVSSRQYRRPVSELKTCTDLEKSPYCWVEVEEVEAEGPQKLKNLP